MNVIYAAKCNEIYIIQYEIKLCYDKMNIIYIIKYAMEFLLC